MARSKRRVSEDTRVPATGLEPAFPSSPTRNPRYVLYCDNFENGRRYIINSYALYAIRKIYDRLVGENEVEPLLKADNTVVQFGDIDIKSDELEEIMAHKYTKAEEAWVLPEPYPSEIDRFLTGRRMGKDMPVSDVVIDAKGRAQPKPAKPKIDRDKFISIAAICDDIKMEAREARGILRKAKLEKPAGGWLFDTARAAEIKELLQKERKA